MTAVSLQINNGVDGFKNSDVTVGTNAPAAGDFEFRWNQVDQATPTAHNITAKEILIALKAFIRVIETGGGAPGPSGGQGGVQFTDGIIGPP